MADGKTHNEHITCLFSCLKLNEESIEAIQDAVYLLLDATEHILGDLRYNETLDYLMDVPQCRNELLQALKLFGEGIRNLQDKINTALKNVVFDKSWTHCEPIDKTMQLLFEEFCPVLKKACEQGT